MSRSHALRHTLQNVAVKIREARRNGALESVLSSRNACVYVFIEHFDVKSLGYIYIRGLDVLDLTDSQFRH